MSERILKALMQLFAIIAEIDKHAETYIKENNKGRLIVGQFLKQELTPEQVAEYLQLFDDFIISHHYSSKKKDGMRKRTSVNSVKLLRICTQINGELTQKQKIVVLLRVFEFIRINQKTTDQELEFAETVSETFNISKEEFESIVSFTQYKKEDIRKDDPNMLVISDAKEKKDQATINHFVDGLEGQIWVLQIPSVNLYFFKIYGTIEVFLNGQLISNNRYHILNQGASIRSAKIAPIYYSDIISSFLTETTDDKIVFKAKHIEYVFPGNKHGLHDFSFSEESGRIVGIMGGSGAGKSTLLNVLNGNIAPTSGSVTINNIDIHKEKTAIEGVVGYISQDDLLIDELTVFQNLFFNAKLCFSDLTGSQIAKKVIGLLHALGLYESKDLKVGNPLQKTISGGQRKRLNIALELIREPSVLFVDEPTSGLSSRDSENIMDLLKELALKGKLVFVVIHQPSSDIFKMFDNLIILDQGGYQIYSGNPVEAVIYFKELANQANSQESECRICGNVNPEQIFNIIETKVVDEFGNQTKLRRTPPVEWNKLFKEKNDVLKNDVPEQLNPPKSTFSIPKRRKQFGVFYKRDVLSKMSNRQYILINLLEAPLLAAVLAFFIKFFTIEGGTIKYLFLKNENIPQYIFIAVVVALFIGLTVAAEEIIKDRKILRRESFLNLSRGTYLSSKILILFVISAIQAFLFVVVGNLILEIKSLTFEYWLVLFSISCTANAIGLNISASFDSAKVIYILIPILIIPQLLFSGVIVKFDKLNPIISNEESVPWVGNIMASRWAYEALAVTQFRDNPFEKLFFEQELQKSKNEWKRDYWVPEIRAHFDYLVAPSKNAPNIDKINNSFEIIQNEFIAELNNWSNFNCKACREIVANKNLTSFIQKKHLFYNALTVMRKQFNFEYGEATANIDKIVAQIGTEKYRNLKEIYYNQKLADQVKNRNELNKILEINGHLIQKDAPIFLISEKSFFQTHFFAPKKQFFGFYFDTFWANIVVLWLMTLIFCITLHFDLLRKGIEYSGHFFSLIKRKK